MISALGTIAQTTPCRQRQPGCTMGFEEDLREFLVQHGDGDRKAYWFSALGLDFRSESRRKGKLRHKIANSDLFELYLDDGKEAVRLRDAHVSQTHFMVFSCVWTTGLVA